MTEKRMEPPMSEPSKGKDTQQEKAKCFLCANTDEQIALFRVLFKGKKQWACARCLPVLIHGPH
jgi:hypothetical protein